MDFNLPAEITAKLAELDAFIEAEIKPLEREHMQFFDHRREYARTDWENDGVPRREWRALLTEMEHRADKAGHLRLGLPRSCGGGAASNLTIAAAREHLAARGLGLHNDLQDENSIVGNFPIVPIIADYGTPEQKAAYLPKMIEGKWTGTMNLTEPHCGTDLGLLRTKAVKQSDGSYKITGTKIFISAGEHDLTENIVHLVLARIEGAPAGIRGTTLFIVPKFLVNADGTLGARNAVTCGSIEEKMGIHGNATCVMNYDGATGFLIGEENRGINAMFVMMNEARLAVGAQGLAQSEVAYQNAAVYARDRLQGRALGGPKFPDKPADPIIVHPDVRRMLMAMRAFNEGARALVIWTALQGDVEHRSPDEKARQAAADHMGLLTPVIKGVLTDQGFANAVMAQQVYGGHGYIREQGVEQFVRDARIAMIYEGANGVQAMDLVGRKLPRDGGRALQAFFTEVQGFIKDNSNDAMKPYVAPLGVALGHLQQATMWLMQNAMAKPDNAGAAATDFMHLFGRVAIGYMWCRMVKAAQAKLATGADERMSAKLTTGRFFMERMLPETATHLACIQSGAASTMELPAEAF
mgnify:CR=1 FL=1